MFFVLMVCQTHHRSLVSDVDSSGVDQAISGVHSSNVALLSLVTRSNNARHSNGVRLNSASGPTQVM